MTKKQKDYIESCWNEIEKRPTLKVIKGGKKTSRGFDVFIKFISIVAVLILVILLLAAVGKAYL